MGLREEKKAATRTAIADAALVLFVERGFERVTVAEVATASGVSVNTVFNYFPTKEDLFFDRDADVVGRLAEAVRTRSPGETSAHAVHRAFLDRLRRRDPTLGLSGEVSAFWQVIDDSPALQARLRSIGERTEQALAEVLAGDLPDSDARVAAALIAGVDRALHAEIRERILAGEQPDSVAKAVRRTANRGFGLLSEGLNGHI
jgi:AcrR family transcriptional regulator